MPQDGHEREAVSTHRKRVLIIGPYPPLFKWGRPRNYSGQAIGAIVGHRLLDFLAGIHDKGPVLHHRFAQWAGRQQQEADGAIGRPDGDVALTAQDPGGLGRQVSRFSLGAKGEAAFVGIDKGACLLYTSDAADE